MTPSSSSTSQQQPKTSDVELFQAFLKSRGLKYTNAFNRNKVDPKSYTPLNSYSTSAFKQPTKDETSHNFDEALSFLRSNHDLHYVHMFKMEPIRAENDYVSLNSYRTSRFFPDDSTLRTTTSSFPLSTIPTPTPDVVALTGIPTAVTTITTTSSFPVVTTLPTADFTALSGTPFTTATTSTSYSTLPSHIKPGKIAKVCEEMETMMGSITDLLQLRHFMEEKVKELKALQDQEQSASSIPSTMQPPLVNNPKRRKMTRKEFIRRLEKKLNEERSKNMDEFIEEEEVL